MPRSRSYQEDLLEALKDPEEAKEYLNAAWEDGNPDIFFLALKDVIEANNKAQVLSMQKTTDLTNIRKVLSDLGYRLMIEKRSA